MPGCTEKKITKLSSTTQVINDKIQTEVQLIALKSSNTTSSCKSNNPLPRSQMPKISDRCDKNNKKPNQPISIWHCLHTTKN